VLFWDEGLETLDINKVFKILAQATLLGVETVETWTKPFPLFGGGQVGGHESKIIMRRINNEHESKIITRLKKNNVKSLCAK
jgi:hypothetical protein